MNKSLIIAVILFLLAQTLVWFQTNGQFLWDIFKKHPIFFAIVVGSLSAYIFAIAHKYCYAAFNGQIWPGRMLAFSSGIILFTLLTWLVMGEEVTYKTIISLILSISIIIIQILL